MEGFDFGYFVRDPEALKKVANFIFDSGLYYGGGSTELPGDKGKLTTIHLDPCGISEVWLDSSDKSIHLKNVLPTTRHEIEEIVGFNA